jgi:drug/metabolite transporter (DMT)-like permease
MDNRTLGLLLITLAVVGLTFVQLMIKARLEVHGAAPLSPGELLGYVLNLLADWQVWVAGAVLVLGAACWYVGLSRVPLSLAYPLAALSYPLVLGGSVLFLHETFSWQLLLGNAAIIGGILLIATGSRVGG